MGLRDGSVMNKLGLMIAILSLLIASCSGQQNQTEALENTLQPTLPPTATTEPAKKLTICLGEEPQSLYFYNASSQAMWSVLESIYDGPFDTKNNTPVPVILRDLPTQENGDVIVQSVTVSRGDKVANIYGDVVALEEGVQVFPEGCTSNTCAITWDGVSELKLAQMKVSFTLLNGILWADGEPLTAEDSVFSYQISTDVLTNSSKHMADRTATYEALDSQVVQWTGIAGYLTTRPASVFWIPLPKHQMDGLTVEEINVSEMVNRSPMGWGAYQIAEWKSGEQIRLVKNPNYYRAGEGLPYFDEVIYRFVYALPDADLSPMTTGECDIMDVSTGLEDQIQSVRELELKGQLKSYFGQGPAWEMINFGIQPSSYDEVFNLYVDRPDYFSDLRTRQAIASCVDREKIIKEVLFSQSQVPATFLPATHPLATANLPVIGFDPVKGQQLLEEVGWVDSDANPATPRVAQGVQNVMPDTPLAINYALSDTPVHRQVAEIVVDSLNQCGIQASAQFYSPSELLAGGADGLLFGRNFDLAQLSWSTGYVPSCFLYSTSEIPSAKNGWLGTKFGGVNLTGYSNTDYDAACSSMLSSGLDETGYLENNAITQQIIANDLPVLPLYYSIKAMVARVDLCGLSMDTSARSALANIESLVLSAECGDQ